MKVSFHGAAREVTGSAHLLEANKKKILVDLGMFQGGVREDLENRNLPCDPKDIDYIVLTHEHLDHCGRIPYAVKKGFRGEVISTKPTPRISELIMNDSAKSFERKAEEAAYLNKIKKSIKNSDLTPLYTKQDVAQALSHFSQSLNYNEVIDLGNDIILEFINAGHIVGAASAKLTVVENGVEKSIVFSGDIGNKNKPIVPNPSSPGRANYVVKETTYGGSIHMPIELAVKELYKTINETVNNNGNVIIPTFAVERAQEILYFLREGIENGELPGDIKVFLDSPMAIDATKIMSEFPDWFNDDTKQLIAKGVDPFIFSNLEMTKSVAASIAINDIKRGAVILAGSGMGDGGRVQHHLKHNLWRPECSVILISFASEGSMSRKLMDGVSPIYIQGHPIDVRAKIVKLSGFSAHADTNGLNTWHRGTGKPDTTFLTHGSEPNMNSFAEILRARGCHVEIPKTNDAYIL